MTTFDDIERDRDRDAGIQHDTYTPIRTADDVTDAHIQEAADCREGLYGGEKLPWLEVIDKLERGNDDDWGDRMDSPAIKHLQRQVAIALKERAGG